MCTALLLWTVCEEGGGKGDGGNGEVGGVPGEGVYVRACLYWGGGGGLNSRGEGGVCVRVRVFGGGGYS